MIYKTAHNYNVRIWDSQGDEYLMHANQLVDTDLHRWRGWHCNAGFDSIYVHENGDVWGSMCKNTYLGNLNNEVELLSGPDVCGRDTCTSCTSDLTVKKMPLRSP